MTTVSTSLFFVSASVIQIRLLYAYGNANENWSFFHYANQLLPSLVESDRARYCDVCRANGERMHVQQKRQQQKRRRLRWRQSKQFFHCLMRRAANRHKRPSCRQQLAFFCVTAFCVVPRLYVASEWQGAFCLVLFLK